MTNQHEDKIDLRAAVLAWWEAKRPAGWVEEDHACNPEVNCSSVEEVELARCAAALARKAQEPAIPEGYVLVPLIPTMEMVMAGAQHVNQVPEGDELTDQDRDAYHRSLGRAICVYMDMTDAAGVAPQEPAVKQGWISSDVTPEVPANDYREFIVSCTRSNGNTYAFSAYYLNKKLLVSRWDEDDDEQEVTGWHFEAELDGDNVFNEVCGAGDAITHYMLLPVPPAKEPSHVPA